MNRPGTSRRPPRGFTLIELVIALAIIGLIALLLFSGLRLGGRAWEAVETVGERLSGPRLVEGFLRRTLGQAREVEVTYDGQTVQVFAGESERIEWVAPLSEHVGLSGLYVLRLHLDGDGESRALILTRRLLHPEILEGRDDIPPWEPLSEDDGTIASDPGVDLDLAGGAFGRTLLLDDVARFELAYHGQADGDTEPDWHDDWQGQTKRPDLVRIRLETRTQSWPDLVVALPDRTR